MSHRHRNPSPPDDDFDFYQNMCITFLKPSRSVQPLNIDIHTFHKNLFISPPVSEDERQSSRNKVTDASCKVLAPSCSIRERSTSEPVLSTLSCKKQTCHANSEDLSTEDSKREKRCKLPKKKASYEESDSDTLSELRFRFDHLKSGLKTGQNLSTDENASVHGTQSLKPRNLKLYPDREIYAPKNVLRSHKRAKHDGASQVKENSKSSSLEHKRASKKKSEKSVSKHTIAVKSEPISDDEGRRHHKSSKRKLKKLPHSDESDSDGLEVSKSRKHHKSHQRYKNISESEDSDYNAADPRKPSRTKSHKKQLKDYREYDYSDTELNSRSARRREGSTKYKKECDLSDSDRSNSKGSPEPDRRYQYSCRNENDTPDSDRSNTRRNSGADKYPKMKDEPVDEFDLPESKYNPDLKAKQDWEEPGYFGPDSFYCQVCQLSLNSESTYTSHINGKKHKKALNSQMLPEIVKGSLNCLAQSREGLRPPAFRNSNQVVLNKAAVLQNIAESHMDNPVPGLQFVKEIHTGKDISYYCELCEAPCMTVSIMPHLLGYKHQLHCMREFFFDFYARNKDRPKKEIEKAVITLLYSHERRYGRGKIVVVKAIPESKSQPSDEAGPSWRNSGSAIIQENKDDMLGLGTLAPQIEFDAVQNDYYCKICDAHMNNRNMYAAHIVGKRHLKNERKTSGERNALMKGGTRAPNIVSELETSLAHNHEDVIVGLSFIRETRTENGPLYNCYICGSSCTVDIVEHLVSLKHRIKYLETVNQNGTIPNAIPSISILEVNSYTREALVLTECEKVEKEHGRGKVEVYVSKSATDYLSRW